MRSGSEYDSPWQFGEMGQDIFTEPRALEEFLESRSFFEFMQAFSSHNCSVEAEDAFRLHRKTLPEDIGESLGLPESFLTTELNVRFRRLGPKLSALQGLNWKSEITFKADGMPINITTNKNAMLISAPTQKQTIIRNPLLATHLLGNLLAARSGGELLPIDYPSVYQDDVLDDRLIEGITKCIGCYEGKSVESQTCIQTLPNGDRLGLAINTEEEPREETEKGENPRKQRYKLYSVLLLQNHDNTTMAKKFSYLCLGDASDAFGYTVEQTVAERYIARDRDGTQVQLDSSGKERKETYTPENNPTSYYALTRHLKTILEETVQGLSG